MLPIPIPLLVLRELPLQLPDATVHARISIPVIVMRHEQVLVLRVDDHLHLLRVLPIVKDDFDLLNPVVILDQPAGFVGCVRFQRLGDFHVPRGNGDDHAFAPSEWRRAIFTTPSYNPYLTALPREKPRL